MTSTNLIDKLVNDALFGDNQNWVHTKDEDLSNIGELEVKEIFPSDAKTIDEVQSFVVKEEVMGTLYHTYERNKP